LKITVYSINIEGEWDAVFDVVKKCHEKIHDMGAPRITTTIKAGTRNDRDQTMADKIDSVKRKLYDSGLFSYITSSICSMVLSAVFASRVHPPAPA